MVGGQGTQAIAERQVPPGQEVSRALRCLAKVEEVGQAALHKGGDSKALARRLGQRDFKAPKDAGLGGRVRLKKGRQGRQLRLLSRHARAGVSSCCVCGCRRFGGNGTLKSANSRPHISVYIACFCALVATSE